MRSESVTSMMQSSAGHTHRSVELFSTDIVMTEMTLAALMSVFNVDKFNSCLQELLDDVVRCNHYTLMALANYGNGSNSSHL